MIIIKSTDNKKIKDLIKLQKASFRKKTKQFLIDGLRETIIAIESGVEIKEVFYCPELTNKKIPNNFKKINVVEVSETVFKKITYKDNPDGFLALGIRETKSLSDIILGKNPLVIILESLEKPGNIGAILRSAYAANIDAIILNNIQTDIFNPNVIRASEGQVFNNQVVSASISETVNWLKKHKIKSFAAATDKSNNYLKADFFGSSAIILGSEANGLSKEWLKLADSRIKIPMRKGIDSLNVSVSAAIIVFEALRQRNISKKNIV